MKYDFTSIMNRSGHDAMAIDALGAIPGMSPTAPKDGFDLIPMWVADMNFPTVDTVPAAIIERAQHPAFGYFMPTDDYYNAIIRWQGERNGACGIRSQNIGYENGVLGGVVSALGVLCSRGDNVLVHTPTYIGFTGVLTNNGYHAVESPLSMDKDGIWRMDLEDMERKIVENHVHATIFCSPHNPTGRVWERKELNRVMALFAKYDVYVISDEIWSDIMIGGHKHIPTQSVSGDARMRTIALYAPSKTFNLAGLIGSYHIIYDTWLNDRMNKQSSLSHYNDMNVLSMHALIGAYTPQGEQWVDELCETLTGNIDFACSFIQQHFEGVRVARPQGTYMLFLDCADWCREHGKTLDEVIQAAWDVGVAWQDGRAFFGPTHIRMNLALPLSRVEEAFNRLARYVFVD